MDPPGVNHIVSCMRNGKCLRALEVAAGKERIMARPGRTGRTRSHPDHKYRKIAIRTLYN